MKKTKTNNSDKNSKKSASAKAAFTVNLTADDNTDQVSDTAMNEDDEEPESGKFQAVKTAPSKSNSSFALTDTFVSFDLQNPMNNSMEAVCYNQYITNVFVTGDDYSEKEIIDNIIDVSTSLSLHPIGLLIAKKIINVKSDRLLKTLFDSGLDKTFINRCVLPKGANDTTVKSIGINTINCVDKINQKVILENLTLPEFSATRRIETKGFGLRFRP
jgi:hypothetical protein